MFEHVRPGICSFASPGSNQRANLPPYFANRKHCYRELTQRRMLNTTTVASCLSRPAAMRGNRYIRRKGAGSPRPALQQNTGSMADASGRQERSTQTLAVLWQTAKVWLQRWRIFYACWNCSPVWRQWMVVCTTASKQAIIPCSQTLHENRRRRMGMLIGGGRLLSHRKCANQKNNYAGPFPRHRRRSDAGTGVDTGHRYEHRNYPQFLKCSDN